MDQMRKLLFLCILFSHGSNAQLPFGKMFNSQQGLYPYPTANAFNVTNDSGFVIGGNTATGFFISRLDLNANILWSKCYSLSGGFVQLKSVIQMSDSGFICAGDAYQNNTSAGVFLARVDKNGILQWYTANQTPFQFRVCKAAYNPNGYVYLLSGCTNYSGEEGICIFKFNGTNGQYVNQLCLFSTYHLPSYDIFSPTDIMIDNNQDLVCLASDLFGICYFFKLDSLLSLTISAFFTNGSSNLQSLFFTGVEKLANGNYLVATSSKGASGIPGPGLVWLNSNGQILAQRKYTISIPSNPVGYGYGTIAHELQNGNIILAAGHYENGPGYLDLLKLKPNGDTIEMHTYRGNSPDFLALAPGENPTIFMQPLDYSQFHTIILKTDSNGRYPCNEFPHAMTYDFDSITETSFTPVTAVHQVTPFGSFISDSSLIRSEEHT